MTTTIETAHTKLAAATRLHTAAGRRAASRKP